MANEPDEVTISTSEIGSVDIGHGTIRHYGRATMSTSQLNFAHIGHGFGPLTTPRIKSKAVGTHSVKSNIHSQEWRKRQLRSHLLGEDKEEEAWLCEKGTDALQKKVVPKKSSTAEHIHEGGEERGKKCRFRTGIAFINSFVLEYVLKYPRLYDLLEKCQPINRGGFVVQRFKEFDQLAAKIADGELHNGLALSSVFPRYLLFDAIKRFKRKYEETRVLVVNWDMFADSQELTPPALTISVPQSEERRQLNLEQHVEIGLEPLQRLTDADHLALFRSIVMPLADEFKPDMVFFICDPSWLPPLSKCLGFIITCLMKLTNGKLLVCQDWSGPGSTEVLLRTLLHDARKEDSISEQTLKGHASPATLDLIKGTTKKYGDHWPCLRKSDVYAAMTDKEYPAHEKCKDIFGADSGKGENSTDVGSSSGNIFPTTGTIVQEQHEKHFQLTKTRCGSSSTYGRAAVHMGNVHDQSNARIQRPTGNDPELPGEEPVKQKMKINRKVGANVTDAEEGDTSDSSCSLFSTSSDGMWPTEETAELNPLKSFPPTASTEVEDMMDFSVGNEQKIQISGEDEANVVNAEERVIQSRIDSANLASTSNEVVWRAEETVKLVHPKFSLVALEQLEKMMDCSFSAEKEIGPAGDVIKLHSYEIIFPANAVDQPTKTKFRLSFLTENLNLPNNLIPIAHPIFCGPGKTIFKKDVTMKIPVWFKITDTSPTAEPMYVHLYSKPSGGAWEVMDSVKLGTSERIKFKCKHFCPILPCVELGDAERGEFTLDYFLCMGDADNFVSCHCVSSDILVKMLEERMKSIGFKVIHPAVTRLSVKPNLSIPVSLISKEPAFYGFESDEDCVLFIDHRFYKHNKSESFEFELVYHGNSEINKLRFTYKVGGKKSRICCKIDGNEQLQMPASTNISRTASSGTAGSVERISGDPIQPVQALFNNDGGHLDGTTVSGNTINMIHKQTVIGASEHKENTRKDVLPPLVLHSHITISEIRAGVSVQGNSSAVLHHDVPEIAIPSSHPEPTGLKSSIKAVNANFSVSDNSQCTVNQTNCSNTVDAEGAARAMQPLANLAVHPQSLADGMNSDQTASKPSVSIQPGDQFEEINANTAATKHGKTDLVQDNCKNYVVVGGAEQDIGPDGGAVTIGSHRISFPEQWLGCSIRVGFTVFVELEPSGLPEDVVPISHVLGCKPGGVNFRKPVTIEMPVWFKLTHPYSKSVHAFIYVKGHRDIDWQLERRVLLSDSDKISFECNHFCQRVVCVSKNDFSHGNFNLDYFLCMKNDGILASCHCVSTIEMVDVLVKRMEGGGYHVIHPAVNRLTVKRYQNIPVCLKSDDPTRYKVEPLEQCLRHLDEVFVKERKYRTLFFKLILDQNAHTDMLSLTYKVADDICPVMQRVSVEYPPTQGGTVANIIVQGNSKPTFHQNQCDNSAVAGAMARTEPRSSDS